MAKGNQAGAGDVIAPEVLRHVPGCEDGRPPLAVEPLAGGQVNASFAVLTPAGRFVLKRHPADTAPPGVDRRREALLHAAAAHAGLAPALVHADPDGRFLVTEYVSGPAWSEADFGDASRLQRLAEHLRALHALEPPEVPAFDPLGLLHQHVAGLPPSEQSAARPLLRRAAEAVPRLEAAGRAPAIIQGDPHPPNVIGTGPLFLIDWEYAAVTDPLYDLACLLAYHPQAAPHAQLLLEHSGLAPAAARAELAEATWLYVLLTWCWHRGRRGEREPDTAQARLERALLARLRA